MRRTHTCGQLTRKEIGKKVVLQGWVDTRRDHGSIIFIDLRDRYGKTQAVFSPDHKEAHKIAQDFKREYVVEIEGTVSARKPGTEKKDWPTGEIEVVCEKAEILNVAEVPPLEIDDRVLANEDVRLKYRYLDLRRPAMQHNLIFRHAVLQAIRKFMHDNKFLEIETPMLIRSTPEGARDYIVPSRVNPGKAYSLPQSPQLYKQILMVAGMDKYFQIARCLRDEDLRADRQPEFTQLDVEMSFPEEEDIYNLGDGLMKHVFNETMGIDLKTPFPRIPYNDAMEKYGTDKPDLRFGLELVDVTELLKKSDFEVFKNSPFIKCLNARGCGNFSKSDLAKLTDLAKVYKAKGLVTIKIAGNKMESNVAKYISDSLQKELLKKTNAKDGDLLLMVADNYKITNAALAALRNWLGKKLNLYDPRDFKFCWVVDFPLFEWNEEEERWDAAHHMFTMPKKEHLKYLETDPGKVHAQCYDLVLNGIEIASGSIRIHRWDIQEKVMKVLGLNKADAERKFGFLLEAFRYGAPPHGGFAPGIDRLVAIMLGIPGGDIREVIAFPKNKNAECPMDGCPTVPDEKTLKELNMKFTFEKK
jgi:aspartyl-tRNA synthetase